VRLRIARIEPAPDAILSAEERESLPRFAGPNGYVLNVHRTLARHPDAMRAFTAWGSYVLGPQNTLPPRERELAILRIGWLCRSGYEWTQHKLFGALAGLSEVEIAAIREGAAHPLWNEQDRALLRAVDQLHVNQFIDDDTWSQLAGSLDDRQKMDLIYTAGQYTLVCMLLNTCGVQLDPGLSLDEDFPIHA